ncbi:MAG: HindIII restriction endonuclease [Pseudomonadota bacterium]
MNKNLNELNNYKINSIDITQQLGQEGINFWESKKNIYQELSREQAIAELIKAEKIDSKINTIKKVIGLKT